MNKCTVDLMGDQCHSIFHFCGFSGIDQTQIMLSQCNYHLDWGLKLKAIQSISAITCVWKQSFKCVVILKGSQQVYRNICHPKYIMVRKGQSTPKRLRQMKSSDLRSSRCKQSEPQATKQKSKSIDCTQGVYRLKLETGLFLPH